MPSFFMQFGLTDIVDIGFVTVLLYTAIVWLRRTRATLVVLGIFILGAVYIVARQLNLQLTAWIFQGFFAIFLIIIVVIFQEELKQVFERIALWSLGRKGTPGLQSKATDLLIGTLADLAKDRIGALIVLPGAQPLERHINGGIAMNGSLSEPLLKSIFDPHSPGHDGAVIIERDRISRFAVHLPLSKNIAQLARVGTRHSAALGLAELTDALCLVVSEERGRISIALDGTLREMNNLQELGSVLERFFQEKRPATDLKSSSFKFLKLKENWVEKVVSLGLAIGLWYVFIPGSKILEVTYQIPVEVEHLPANLVLEKIEPSNVSVTFDALGRFSYLFESKTLKATIDASLAALGRRTFRISEEDISHPRNLALKELDPSTVKISVKERALKKKAKPKKSEEPKANKGKAG
jgi:uncharacterized protein (TIGR00159 family)